MTDDELRALVRDAVARHLHRAEAPSVPRQPPRPAAPVSAIPHRHGTPAPAHPALAMYMTLVNPGDACLIEPAVPCNHCGYCKSHGH